MIDLIAPSTAFAMAAGVGIVLIALFGELG